MSKKKLIVLAVIILGVVVGGAAASYFLFFKKPVGKISDREGVVEIKDDLTADLVYEDEAGFSFNYPKGIKIEDKTPEDKISYSLLELSDAQGKLTIWVFDVKEKSVEEWVKNNTKYKEATLSGATTLAGISAKQYKSGNNLLTLAYKEGVLYLIEGPKEDQWSSVHNSVVESFSLQDLGSPGSPSDGTIYEEEVVE